MRVFIINQDLLPAGGPCTQITLLAQYLSKTGHDIVVFVENLPERNNQYVNTLEENRIRIYKPHPWIAKSFPIFDLRNIIPWMLLPLRLPVAFADMVIRKRTFARSYSGVWGRIRNFVPNWQGNPLRCALYIHLEFEYLRKEPDIVLIVGSPGGILWSSRRNLPSIYREGSMPGQLGLNWWQWTMQYVQTVDTIWTVSRNAISAIREFFNYQGSVVVIQPMINLDKIIYNVDSPLALDINPKVILGTAGRLSPEKGHQWLIRALPEVIDKSYPLSIQLWIAGDGEERERLEELARELGVIDNVLFLGYRTLDEMYQFWRELDLFVMPSLLEGAPSAIIEAMAHAKPVIATAVGDIAELVEQGFSGIITSPRDPQALAEAILSIISDPFQARKMGEHGRLICEHKYDVKIVAPLIIQMFQDVIDHKKYN